MLPATDTAAPTLQAVAVQPAVNDVLALLGEECRARGVAVATHVTPPQVRVLADEAELRQVLVNLIHNALHATPRGGRIDIEGRPAAPEGASDTTDYTLSVTDTGCGIASHEQPLIFMPFFSRRADGQRGTGLGLAIAKAALERFGGRIGVRSAPGEGACFTLRLRAAREDGA